MNERGIEIHEFNAYATESIIAETMDFRKFYVNSYGQVGESEDDLTRRAGRFVEIANVNPPDNRIVSFLDRNSARNEFKIFEVSIDDGTWLDQGETTARRFVSSTFAEFVERSLEFMTKTENGFDYWNDAIRGPSLW